MQRTLAKIISTVGCLFALGATAPVSAVTIVLDQTATYRYINATGTPLPIPANWFAVGFDDSSWNVGNGPFSSGATAGTILDQGNVNAPFAPGPTQPIPTTFTQWDVNQDPLLRTTFSLAAPTALTIWIAVDNGIGVLGSTAVAGLYVNGVQTTNAVNAEGAAFRWEVAFNVPSQYTFSGANLIALQLEDHGVSTGFDMMVTTQSSDPTIPPFTTNPPPAVPEPASWAMLLVGLACVGSFAARRRSANSLR
jgi:PEP-CTERM motif